MLLTMAEHKVCERSLCAEGGMNSGHRGSHQEGHLTTEG